MKLGERVHCYWREETDILDLLRNELGKTLLQGKGLGGGGGEANLGATSGGARLEKGVELAVYDDEQKVTYSLEERTSSRGHFLWNEMVTERIPKEVAFKNLPAPPTTAIT